jgi:hypothetical protein
MPRFARPLVCLIAAALALPVAPAFAISSQNPYRSFNRSGITYGSTWRERAQRQVKRVWACYSTPSRSYGEGSELPEKEPLSAEALGEHIVVNRST